MVSGLWLNILRADQYIMLLYFRVSAYIVFMSLLDASLQVHKVQYFEDNLPKGLVLEFFNKLEANLNLARIMMTH